MSAGFKRRQPPSPEEENVYPTLPALSDHNAWYYPSHGYDSEEEELGTGIPEGNWGRKLSKGARWIRKGKIAPWGVGSEEWEAEERARKRLKSMLSPSPSRSPSPPVLPHLRSPSPPCLSPYPAPITQHLSYASFVMDKAVTHTFRTPLLDELEQATNGLIEGEATLRRALGKLWRVMSADPDQKSDEPTAITKTEDGVDNEDVQDLTPAAHKIFLPSLNNEPPTYEPSQFSSPEMQMESLEKSLSALRELQDDGREYVERLQEIREGLGDARAHRDNAWNFVRERAIKELHELSTG